MTALPSRNLLDLLIHNTARSLYSDKSAKERRGNYKFLGFKGSEYNVVHPSHPMDKLRRLSKGAVLES